MCVMKKLGRERPDFEKTKPAPGQGGGTWTLYSPLTELENKTAEIETEHVEDDQENQNNDNSVEIDHDMNKPLVEFWTKK